MIAQRFSALGWVAGVAGAATCLYLVSLQVAAERGKLEAVEREIASAQRDMRQLQTEFGTRASMRQLERWNGDVLALSAPKADQYLKSEIQLASLDAAAIGDKPNAPPPSMALLTPPPADAVSGDAHLQSAALTTAQRPAKLQRVAMITPALGEELARAAATETRKRP